jgi:hypothetical protein
MKRLFGCSIGNGRVVVAAGAGGRRLLVDAAFSGAPQRRDEDNANEYSE